MSSDFTHREDLSTTTTPQDTPFAPTPVFAREGKSSRKSRAGMFANTAPSESRTFSPATEVEADSGFILPEREVRDIRPGRSVPMAALMAIPAAIVLAGGAYFLMQPRSEPETLAMVTAPPAAAPVPMTPSVAPAPVEATPLPIEQAQTAVPRATPQPQRQASAARTRPAAPPAAVDSGVDASATPASPLPYTAVAPQAAPPSAVNPPVITPPENPAPTMPSTAAPSSDTSVNPPPTTEPEAVIP